MSDNCRNCNNKRAFNLELMLTLGCDMRCTYCYGKDGLYNENKGLMSTKVLDRVIDEIDNIETKSYFQGYSYLNIQFFGGEPSLAPNHMEILLDRYKDNDNIVFKMVTNGNNFEKIKPFIDKYTNKIVVNGESKFHIQISYDGEPIHSKNRINTLGNTNIDQIKKYVKYMQDNNFIYSLKSTVTYDSFKYMYDAYIDYLELCNFSKIYFPTIDYSDDCNNLELSEIEKKKYNDELTNSIIKIAAFEIKNEFIRKNNYSNFAWFNNNRAICQAGAGYNTISLNGDIFPCHFGPFSSRDIITNIFDKDYEEKIIYFAGKINNFKGEPEECKNCDTIFCPRCQMSIYNLSNKLTEEEKYIDYTQNDFRCELYNIASKIKKASDTFLK